MNWTLFRNMIMTAGTLLAVAACGGGGGTVASGGTGGTGISSGSVTGFGSVFVNGVEFSTTTSSVTLNGTSGPDEATDPHRGLKVGMVVEVEGSFDDNGTTGTATSITYKDNLEGPISSITGTTTRTAVILGQTVIMDSQTVVDPMATLAPGDFVEVSGLKDKDGNIHATYVSKKTPSSELEVKGTIQNLDTLAKTFKIDALIVYYSSANTSGLPGGAPADGQYVEVQGTSSDGGLTLTATEVDLDDDTLGAMDAGRVEMEGFVTDLKSQSEFKVGTQVVQTTGSTVFENGTANNIAIGRKMEVEGPLAGGMLTATKVSFEN